MRNGIVGDALDGLLAVTPLLSLFTAAAAVGQTSAEKIMVSMPLACAIIITPVSITTGKTLDVTVQGRNKSTDAWTNVAVAAQMLPASVGTPQRFNVPTPYKRYQTLYSTGGSAFNGTTDNVAATVHLVGTNAKFAPITQVN